MTDKKVQENFDLLRRRFSNLKATVDSQQKEINGLRKVLKDHQQFFEVLTGQPVHPSGKVRWEFEQD